MYNNNQTSITFTGEAANIIIELLKAVTPKPQEKKPRPEVIFPDSLFSKKK
jgi:hypothetical protein